MYNNDGTLRVKLQKKAPPSSLSSWSTGSTKENCATSNSPTASPKAAGVKSKVTTISGNDSPLKQNSRPGSDVRARQNQGTLSFKNDGLSNPHYQSERGVRDVSDTKKKALYNSSVFASTELEPENAPVNELSELKLREVTGNDIFNQAPAPEEPQRAILGGVRKAPGGGSSLSMKDLHPQTPGIKMPAPREQRQGRHPGGESSFGFGW